MKTAMRLAALLLLVTMPARAQNWVFLKVWPNPMNLVVGDSFQLNGGLYDKAGHKLNVATTWVSTNPAVITVTQKGLVRATGKGIANAELHLAKMIAWSTAIVTLKDTLIASLQIIVPATIVSGVSTRVKVVARNKAGQVLTGKRVNCTSSDTSVVRLSTKCDTTEVP